MKYMVVFYEHYLKFKRAVYRRYYFYEMKLELSNKILFMWNELIINHESMESDQPIVFSFFPSSSTHHNTIDHNYLHELYDETVCLLTVSKLELIIDTAQCSPTECPNQKLEACTIFLL